MISEKTKPFQIRWNEPLGMDECPYARRWVFLFFDYGIRIHQWYRSDDKRHFHDHPWWFITMVLKGGYTDVSPDGRDTLRFGSIRFRKAEHRHYVDVPKHGALTILFTGRPIRKWGFWIDGKKVIWRPLRYMSKYGHPPCEEQ